MCDLPKTQISYFQLRARRFFGATLREKHHFVPAIFGTTVLLGKQRRPSNQLSINRAHINNTIPHIKFSSKHHSAQEKTRRYTDEMSNKQANKQTTKHIKSSSRSQMDTALSLRPCRFWASPTCRLAVPHRQTALQHTKTFVRGQTNRKHHIKMKYINKERNDQERKRMGKEGRV